MVFRGLRNNEPDGRLSTTTGSDELSLEDEIELSVSCTNDEVM